MIIGLDHIAIACADVDSAARELAAVVGCDPAAAVTAAPPRLQLANVAIVLHPSGAAATGDPAEGARGPGLVFATADIDKAAHRLERRGLPGTFAAASLVRILDLDPSRTYGVPLGLVTGTPARATDATADIAGLDHVVVRTPYPERAVALYGGRLGLDLRLDRTNPKLANRLLFFVCGDLVVEISHDTRQGVGTGPDAIWGLAWRARDITRAHARMVAAGVTVSELRAGRRPGTRVFTVKSHTAGIPTLVIGGDGLARS